MGKRVSEQQFAAAYAVAKRIFEGEITKNDGVEELASVYGLNRASAGDFIYDFKCMCTGKVFHRGMSASATDYFIEHIHRDYGQSGLAQAVKSLEQYIEYTESVSNSKAILVTKVLEKHRSRLTNCSLGSFLSELNQQVDASLALSREERLARIEQASRSPVVKVRVETTYYSRNPDIAAETLSRADGFCERCKNKAPFTRKSNRTPYLEVHHKKRLADGGEDTLENTIAVCPNCHRELHFGVNPSMTMG